MNTQHQKIVNLSYLAFAILIAFIALSSMMKVANTYDLESKVKNIEYIIRGLSVLVGAGIFFGLYRNVKTNTFMNEVVVELFTKVTWPTQKETYSATLIVIVTVVLAGIVLGVFDWLWTMALRWVL